MKNILYILLAFSLYGCDAVIVEKGKTEEKIQAALEEAYFEGQRDAIEGDIRIRKNDDSCWIWTKSCWDSGEQPKYNPSIVCDGGLKSETND